MKKLFVGLLTCICAAVFSLCLVSCGPDYAENFAGTWVVTEMTDSTGSDLTPVIEQLASSNEYMTLDLTYTDKEKTATFDLAGQTTLTGTWRPTGEFNCQISFEGYDEINAQLTDGKLSFEENGQTMVCTRQQETQQDQSQQEQTQN